jgi:hypothetical protein
MIMKTAFAFLCVLLTVCLSTEAADEKPSAESKGAHILKKYPDADLNGDGQLTREEFKEYRASQDRSQDKNKKDQQTKIAPTQANVSYLAHPSNVIDFYKAKSKKPTPMVLYIHGGGFRGGSKNGISQETLKELLGAGISVAAVEYRLIGVAPLPTAHYDCARAIQFIRSKAKEWNFDKTKVGAFGGSAGAQLSMWLAFHDDMANPKSKDPIERESTRLSCVATSGGQATMDLNWWIENIPGYDAPHRDPNESYRTTNKRRIAMIVEEISVINHLTKDDPPMFMRYKQHPDDPVPDDPKEASGWSVHHVQFGIALKEKADGLGIEADLKYPGSVNKYESEADFFITKFGKK